MMLLKLSDGFFAVRQLCLNRGFKIIFCFFVKLKKIILPLKYEHNI